VDVVIPNAAKIVSDNAACHVLKSLVYAISKGKLLKPLLKDPDFPKLIYGQLDMVRNIGLY
jgi:hypothetical protein